MEQRKKMFLIALLQIILLRTNHMMCMLLLAQLHARNTRNMRRRCGIRYSLIRKIPDITTYMDKLTELTDVQCINNLRMDRNCFLRLCYVLCHGAGLKDEKYVSVREQVTLFLKVLAHHDKNRIMGFHWQRSGHTISRYFNKTLRALLLLEKHIYVTPKPIAEENNNCHDPWKWFKGCLGALDGTFVDVWALRRDQPRYRTRKGRVSVNVLGVCDINMQFIYVLAGWEGSTADSRILKDAVNRPTGLKVPQGNYYLVDGGYTNCEGYLAPYCGKRYHLKEWGNGNVVPRDYLEYFNMKHAKARNIIERAFGRLKTRWGILKEGPCQYPMKVQNRIIVACALLHNYIRTEMAVDPMDAYEDVPTEGGNNVEHEFIEGFENSPAWNNFRDTIAQEMYADWRQRRGVNRA